MITLAFNGQVNMRNFCFGDPLTIQLFFVVILGANAPLNWMRTAVEHICPDSSADLSIKRRKILLGLNLYGNDFTPDGGSAIIGHEYLNFLKFVKGRLSLDDTNSENFFEVK